MSQTHHGLLIHVIFSTKLRKPIIGHDWRAEMYAYMGGVVREHNATLLNAGGIEDHIHGLIKIHPAFAIADTVRLLKCNTSRWINDQRKVNCKFEWQRGYGVFSVSQSMAETVMRYICKQQEHHLKQSFRQEYLEILRRHRIEFDERYVFDEEIVA